MKFNFFTMLAVLLCGTACTPSSHKDSIDKNGLIYCSEGTPETFNPQLVTSGTTIDIIAHQLYNRLIGLAPVSGRFNPELAERWDVSADGTRYTFFLRDDVEFHSTDYFTPTRKFNADDVIFSFNRILDNYNEYHYVNGGNYPFFQSVRFAALVSNIKKIDDYTVVFELYRPDNTFLSNLSTDFAVLLSKEYADHLLEIEQPELLDSYPIGTGPFKFKEYKPNVLVRFYDHEKYWKNNVFLSQLVFDITVQTSNRMAKLLTKECDVVAYPVHSQLSLLELNEEITVQREANLNVGFWAFNTSKAPFSNPLVRKALAYGIDKDAILQAVYYGQAQYANSILPPSSWAFKNTLSDYYYDPDKARNLLKKAGLEDGFTMDIWAMPVQRVYNPNATKMAELIQADLNKIGITANIVNYEWSTFRRKLAENQHDSVLIGWSADNPDPDNFFSPLLSCAAAITGSNRSGWCHEEFDNLLVKARTTTDLDERTALYYQAQEILADELPLYSIAHSLRFQAQQSDIEGLTISPYGGLSFEQVRKK
ncbi:ABC transporter substrate-binding protein SapA [Flocculibacter collagenilyticus]|uniref:ABC transporter substrate-binding protein SapA n=1 Tax=Flocculibacter collagenilyticus TaxID=2744479 RepID=UPI0018F439A1|nr:ABC transporter substrate-binding protein SapA [Flocculibacter collagenilyticus]